MYSASKPSSYSIRNTNNDGYNDNSNNNNNNNNKKASQDNLKQQQQNTPNNRCETASLTPCVSLAPAADTPQNGATEDYGLQENQPTVSLFILINATKSQANYQRRASSFRKNMLVLFLPKSMALFDNHNTPVTEVKNPSVQKSEKSYWTVTGSTSFIKFS